MESLLMIARGVAFGLGAAVPIGPVNIEIARRALTRSFSAGAALGFGAVTVDTVYFLLAMVGVAPLLDRPMIRGPVTVCGILMLAYLGGMSLRGGLRAMRGGDASTTDEMSPFSPAARDRSFATDKDPFAKDQKRSSDGGLITNHRGFSSDVRPAANERSFSPDEASLATNETLSADEKPLTTDRAGIALDYVPKSVVCPRSDIVPRSDVVRQSNVVPQSDIVPTGSSARSGLFKGYLTGILMTGLSPLTLAFWFVGFPGWVGTITHRPERDMPMICTGVLIGTAGWVVFFAGLMSVARRWRRHWWLVVADVAGGVTLLGFAGIAVWRSIF